MLSVDKLLPRARGLAPALLKRATHVVLDWDTRQKSRFDATDSHGRALGVFLPRGTVVRGGDVLVAEDGSLIRVEAAAQPVMVVTHCPEHGSLFDLLRAAYHLGNRHVALELQRDRLQLEPDHVLADMLRHMHLIVTETNAPFEPEGGAYASTGTHAHEGHAHGAHSHGAHSHRAHSHEAHSHEAHPHEAHPHEAHPHEAHPHEAHPHEAHSHEGHSHGKKPSHEAHRHEGRSPPGQSPPLVMNPATLLGLIWLASPALPVGGFSYSEGLESAVESGRVSNERQAGDWLLDQLHLGLARSDMAAAAKAFDAWRASDAGRVRELNDWVDLTRESSEMRQQARQMGRSLADWLRNGDSAADPRVAALAALEPAPTWPVAFALAAALTDASARDAMLAYAFAWAENMVQAAMKGVPLGQGAAQRMLGRLARAIPAAVETAMSLPDGDRQAMLPMLAVVASQHETQYSRLFRS
jgi:urease accessory protein